MSQHTPGSSVQSVQFDGKFTVIYDLSDGTSSAFRFDPALGRLIAAAPDLLTALKAVSPYLKILLDGGYIAQSDYGAARTALRKARPNKEQC